MKSPTQIASEVLDELVTYFPRAYLFADLSIEDGGQAIIFEFPIVKSTCFVRFQSWDEDREHRDLKSNLLKFVSLIYSEIGE